MRCARPVARAFSPLDEELALLPGAFAPRLVADMVHLGTWIPFPHLPDVLRRLTGTPISEATIRRATEAAGAAYVAVQAADLEALAQHQPPAPAGPAALQVSVDGAMVPLVGKGAWTEVKTLAIGQITPTPAAGVGGPPPDAPPAPTVGDLSYYSRRADATTFSHGALVEVRRRGVGTAGTVGGVVDGADWCQTFLDRHRPDAVRILDFPHATEHLAQIAQAAFGPGTRETATWLETQCHVLKHQAPDGVLATIHAVLATVRADPVRASDAETISKALPYLEKRVNQLRSADFLAQGYPIGSGIVESANKLVVEARLKGAGMHWAPAHVDPMVALRTIVCADRWEEAWPRICLERRRQHRAAAQARHARRWSQRSAAALPAPPTPPVLRTTLPSPTALPAAPPPDQPSTPIGRPAATHPWRRPFLTSRRLAIQAAKL
jgi:hypothetical protein